MIKKAMIMADGVGSRLDPLTQATPKPLIPIANKPIMELILNHLGKYGIKDVIANTHYLGEQIQEKFENSYDKIGINFEYLHENKLSGTAGGVKKCQGFFDTGETFVVVSGDALTDINIEELVQKHKATGAIATMALMPIPDSELPHFGVVVTDNQSRVVEFQEKPSVKEAKSNLVNTGIYVFETKVFDYIPAGEFCDFAKNVFPAIMEDNGLLFGHMVRGSWNDIGTIKQYKESSQDILKDKLNLELTEVKTDFGWAAENCNIPDTSKFNGTSLISSETKIEENVQLEGFNTIGENCAIKSGAVITDSIIWDNVVIEENAVLNNCIIANNSIIKKNSIIKENSIIAANCTIAENSEITSDIKLNKGDEYSPCNKV